MRTNASFPDSNMLLLGNGLGIGQSGMCLFPNANSNWTISAGTPGTTFDIYLNPSGGNVGIGTTNPQAALHVQGNIMYSGVINNIKTSVTVSTATNVINIPSLDMNADGGSYRIVFKANNNGGGNFDYLMYINGDFTNGNYFYNNRQFVDNMNLRSGSSPVIFGSGGSSFHVLEFTLTHSPGNRHVAYGQGMFETGALFNVSSVQGYLLHYFHNSTTNITSLYFTSTSTGSGFQPGSSVTIYKV